jgi:hypothetical protein
MTAQVLEGTWEEIRAHEREFAGQRLRVQVITPERPVVKKADVPVIFDPSADPMMTKAIREVLDSFVDFLLADIREHAVPANKVEIIGVQYPDDGTEGITVQLWLYCGSIEEMSRYLTEIYSRIPKWQKNLDADQETIWSRLSFIVWQVRNA